MVLPENNAIMPRLRIIRAIEDAKRERRAIECKYTTKYALQQELRNALKTHSDKSSMRALKMKFKMNGLPPIIEESIEDMYMENDDLDKFLNINDKIKLLETQRDQGLDIDQKNRRMYCIAEQIIEAEL